MPPQLPRSRNRRAARMGPYARGRRAAQLPCHDETKRSIFRGHSAGTCRGGRGKRPASLNPPRPTGKRFAGRLTRESATAEAARLRHLAGHNPHVPVARGRNPTVPLHSLYCGRTVPLRPFGCERSWVERMSEPAFQPDQPFQSAPGELPTYVSPDDVALLARRARPTYRVTRQIYLRSLGLIYLIAFLSLWVQIDGLIGSKGLL